jgi:hypothetical protein
MFDMGESGKKSSCAFCEGGAAEYMGCSVSFAGDAALLVWDWLGVLFCCWFKLLF